MQDSDAIAAEDSLSWVRLRRSRAFISLKGRMTGKTNTCADIAPCPLFVLSHIVSVPLRSAVHHKPAASHAGDAFVDPCALSKL